MYERFTDRARRVLQLANQEAQRFNHDHIGTEHILLGLAKEGSSVAATVLKNLGVCLGNIRLETEKIVQPSVSDAVTMGKLPHTPRAKEAIALAIKEAEELGRDYVGTEHLLLGILRGGENIAAQVLLNLDVKLDDVRIEVMKMLATAGPAHETSGSLNEPKLLSWMMTMAVAPSTNHQHVFTLPDGQRVMATTVYQILPPESDPPVVKY